MICVPIPYYILILRCLLVCNVYTLSSTFLTHIIERELEQLGYSQLQNIKNKL